MAKNDALERELEIPASEIEYIADCGSGSYGTVYRVVWKNRLVAVKIPRYRNENDGEIRHLTVLNHSNIIKFFGIVKKDEKKSLVMEFSKIGSLSRILHERTDIEYCLSHVINWGLQTACGLAYLHSRKPRPMMHRDLKPQNILLFDDGRTVKLCDFGTLRTVDTQVTSERGSPAYMAPEVIMTENYTEKCDMYSWGVLLWEMITREKPYIDQGFHQVYFAVCNGHKLQLPQEVHPIFPELIAFCWTDKPEDRPDMETVQEIMEKLFVLVVDENDPLRCTSLNISNLTDVVIDSNNENSFFHPFKTSKMEDGIDLRTRHLHRMALVSPIISEIDYCSYKKFGNPYISDLMAFQSSNHDDPLPFLTNPAVRWIRHIAKKCINYNLYLARLAHGQRHMTYLEKVLASIHGPFMGAVLDIIFLFSFLYLYLYFVLLFLLGVFLLRGMKEIGNEME